MDSVSHPTNVVMGTMWSAQMAVMNSTVAVSIGQLTSPLFHICVGRMLFNSILQWTFSVCT